MARLLRRLRPGRRAAIAAGVLIAARVALAVLPHPALRERIALSRAVTAADGTLLRLTLADDGQYRMWTNLDQLSPSLVEATLRYEDRHFYWHPGVNPFALGRAALATYVTGGRRIGGSTLTMQLARRRWGLSSRTPLGKLQQIARALQLEAQYSKRQILEAYLNVAPYGGNIEGAGAASLLYFRKPAAKLTLAEALTLAVIPQSPVRRAAGAPTLDRARDELLRATLAAHPGRGDESALHDWPALKAPRSVLVMPGGDPEDPAAAALPSPLPFRAPHFVDEVLRTDGAADADGRVVTTLDAHLQRLCERHVRAYVARERTRGITNAAAMLVDTRTMGIRALVGSADFFDDAIGGQVDGALAPRSPGSTLKPLVYALGMDQGVLHPATMLKDVPTAYAAYSPENFDGRFVGPLSAKDALIRSRNVPALFVAAHLARPTLYDALKTAGVDLPHPEDHYGLGLALGTGEVTMADLLRLYGALGNGGLLRPLVWRAPQPGRPRRENSEGVRLVSEESAFLVVDMLLDNPPPASRHSSLSATRRVPVAWKTGTSWGFRDAWSVGLFGHYALAVWVGDFSGAGNPAFVGVEAAAPLFFQIVDSIAAEDPGVTSFAHAPPRGVRKIEVCALSGGVPTAHCPHRRLAWFIPGRSPIAPCEIHRTLALDAQGRRTCPGGPPASRSEVFEVWSSDLAKQFAAAGLPRRALPPPAPGCAGSEESGGVAPRIVSPLAGVTYDLRASPGAAAAGSDGTAAPGATLALQAVTGGDASELFWFADRAFIGKAARGETLFWKPPGAGHYTVRAVDDLGRSDVRQVATERADDVTGRRAP